MLGFGKNQKDPAGPPALTSQELRFKLDLLEVRMSNMEECINAIAMALRANLDRIDYNTQTLDKNMHNLASLVLRPPKDFLNGSNNEVN